MFQVGQKVVCVDVRPRAGRAPRELTLNAIYTISGFQASIWDDAVGLYLAEIPPKEDPGFWGAFHPSRFRPIQERKTDIGFAHEILRKHSKKKPADADRERFETALSHG